MRVEIVRKEPKDIYVGGEGDGGMKNKLCFFIF